MLTLVHLFSFTNFSNQIKTRPWWPSGLSHQQWSHKLAAVDSFSNPAQAWGLLDEFIIEMYVMHIEIT